MTPENPKDQQDKRDAPQGAPASAPAAAGGSDVSAGAEGAGAHSLASVPLPAAAAAKSAAAAGSAQSAAAGGEAAAKAAASPPAAKPVAVAGTAAAAKAAAAPAPPKPQPRPQPIDEFDPLGWDVPIICKDCDKPFVVPYRNFHAGVVFHCPSCQGSWVPNTTIAKEMRQIFAAFWVPRKRAREAFKRGELKGKLKIDRAEFERRQADELKAFRQRLERMAAELKPAGKLVRPKGLAAMFT